MEEIIKPIDYKVLKRELNNDRYLRDTNFGNRQIFIVNAHNSPNTMLEIGRLREFTFRTAGGGTGKSCDIDSHDTNNIPYEQLIVWDEAQKSIIGGYRFILGNNIPKDLEGNINLATTGLFNFSEEFILNYLPKTIELGRSFVQPNFQPNLVGRIGMYSLDNLWDGLGALIVKFPEMNYFFGKVTMYSDMNKEARDLILYFLNKHFPDSKRLVWPKEPLKYYNSEESLKSILISSKYEEDFKLLVQKVRELGSSVPPLVNAYMNLSKTMKTFGTSKNLTFGNVEETGILVKISDIYPDKTDRHINTFNNVS